MMNDFEKALVDKITELYMDIDVLKGEKILLKYRVENLEAEIKQLKDTPEESEADV